MTIRTATGLIAAYMHLCGFHGWTSFWNVIYVLPGFEHDQRLLRHERKHLEQIKPFVSPRALWYATAAPTTGTWVAGDLIYNSNPTASGFIGWICTASGTPGTWKTFGAISA